MSKKNVLRNLVGIILILCLAMLPNIVNAATMSPSLYFGITELRESGMGYSIGDPGVNGTTGPAAKIWNIVQYSGPDTDDPTEANVYCVKAGVGFMSGEGVKGTQEYNVKFDMYTEREAIAAQNSVLSGLVNGGHYNELLALANLIYIPGESTEEEKTQLIESAGIYQEQYPSEEYYLTDDEIESVQQAAMWYFTNYGEENGKYDKYSNTSWLWYTTDGSEYENLTGYNPTSVEPNLSAGKARQEQAELLYKYLIDTAKKNASQYENSNVKYRNKLTLYASTENAMAQPLMDVQRIPQEFDLALRKYITKVNGENVVNSRIPTINEATLENGTTATYNHRKDPITVENGNVVTYNITIYNEGDLDGRATKVIDQLPTGLKYSKINTQGFTATYDEATNKLTITREANHTENLAAYEKGNLDSETIEIECIVNTNENGKILTNVAWIEEEIDEYGNIITNEVGEDRDSEPATAPNVNKDNMESYKGNEQNKDDLADSDYFYKGEQDDDDFEKLIVNVPEEKQFDLKLIKRITKVNGEAVPERLLGVDITNLANGSQTTADYKMNKEPVLVETGDLVTYTFRIYNEGEIDGYAEEITEDIPEGLEFLGADVDSNMNPITDEDELKAVEFNTSMGWTYVQGDSTKIATDYLGKGKGEELTTPGANLIKAFNPDSPYSDTEGNKNPDYKEISVIFKVVADDSSIGIVRNEAAITEDADSNGDPVDDRDSNTDNWVKYEDDEDYDNIKLPQEFDLALRKFISKVDDTTYNRAPNVDLSALENGTTAIYNHPKDPVAVKRNSTVVYTIRVYNEGKIDGYAESITDYLPEELEFLPEHEINTKYEWKISEDGRTVTTDYLSSAKETEERQNEIKAFNGQTLDYKEVQIACKVKEEAIANVKLTNLAEITEDSDNDRDSTPDNIEIPSDEELPGYKDNEIDKDYVPGQEDDDDFEKVFVEEIVEEFDLALRKFISKVDDTTYDRAPNVDLSALENGTTAIYNHPKDPVAVKRNSTVVYTIRVYNEGKKDGYAESITDYLPEGLEFLPEHEINTKYEWKISEDGRTVTTDYLSSAKETGERQNEIKAFDGKTLDYKEVQIACRVKEEAIANVKLTNLAEITEDSDNDRDSTPDNIKIPSDEELPGYKDDEIDKDYVPGQEDDDDFEKVFVEEFDLALRKFISKVDDITYDRVPNVDLSALENGTTAIYNHPKDPVAVKRNSTVVYTIRVYNEGKIDGYAESITDYLPQELEFLPEHEINTKYEWKISENGRTVTTDYLSSAKETEERQNEIKAFDGKTLDYKEVQIACKVKEEAIANVKLTNLAEITEDSDDDRDSTPDNIEIPSDEELSGYKDDEIDKDYVPGQEDDDDFEKVFVQDFDLALRKFITKVDEEEVDTRIPEVSYDREEDKISYDHTKEPVEVVTGNVVEYTIRVYNEGDMAGYAKEVGDDIPDGLKYLPENETNKAYRWVMYDEEGNETENVEEAVEIRTDYLSKEQEQTEGENLLQAFNPEEPIGEGNPDYRDIKVAFEVVEPNESDRIIINSAQITDDSDENGDPVEDIDSDPGEWNEGEDDQDREYIKLTYFDLALRKWVTEAIVIEDGKETITQTGHTAEMDPEPVVKVELYRKDLNDVVVKFRYKIRVTNEGDIAGYAKEITDYVPDGLKFVAEDNPGWTDEGNNIISTRLLENTLLQPGESAEVEVVLTWINSEDNMGQMINIAEISEDYNDKGVPDRDSTPDNQVWGEDDIDDAPVLLSIETGQQRIYFTLGLTVLGTLAGGLFLIKKFVI